MDEFSALVLDKQKHITAPFEKFAESVNQKGLIAVIRDDLRYFEEEEYPRLLTQVATWSLPPKTAIGEGGDEVTGENKEEEESGSTQEAQIQYISSRSINVNFDKAWLSDEVDVDRYLASLREVLLEAIREGKRIQT